MRAPIILVLYLLGAFHNSNGLKILNIFPTVSKSHEILGNGINKLLLSAGHEVTYITAFMRNNTNPKFRQIDVTKNFDMIPEDRLIVKNFKDTSSSSVLSFAMMMAGLHMMGRWTIQNENVQKLLNDPNEHFDIVIVDWTIDEITYSGIAKIYDAPLIWVSTLEPHFMLTSYVDEALHPAYTSNVLAPKTPPFTFMERVSELFTQLTFNLCKETLIHLVDSWHYNSEIAPIIRKRGREPPSAQELRNNASLIIANSHVSFGQAHRLPANYIAVGGFHIEDKVLPLTGEIKNIVENSKHGVIYFSLGSLIKSKDLPEEVKAALVTMLGKLKQTVIWKFEEDRDNLPDNVHIVKWAPQQSILAHKNCVLFITQGGLLSTSEAIHHGVPIVGIPVFVDQYENVERAVKKGFAKQVDIKLTPDLADDLEMAIQEIIGNPQFKKNIEELSFIYNHRPVKPGVELVHWVEHVAKTKGAPHMRSPALMVPFYQKMYLDLLALIVLVIITLRYLYKNWLKNLLYKKKNVKKNN